MGFTHAQGTAYNSSTTVGVTTITTSLVSNPSVGDVVCVGVITLDAGVSVTVKDDAATPNTYTKSTNSPSNVQNTSAGSSWLFWLVAGATATKNIIVALSANTQGVLGAYVDDFSVSGGTAAFDKDGAGNGTTTSPTNSPTINPAGTAQLIYGHGVFSNAATGVSGAWVQNTHGIGTFSEDAAWQLSISSGTTVAFTFTGTENWDTMGMTFTFTPSGGTTSHLLSSTGAGG